MDLDATTIVALCGGAAGLATAAVGIYRARSEKTKTLAETEGSIVGTAVTMAERLTGVASSLIGPLQAQLQVAQGDLARTRERVAALEAQTGKLDESYKDCRRREREAIQRATTLANELEALRGFLQARRAGDLDDDSPDRMPRRDLWSEERREAYRRAVRAGMDPAAAAEAGEAGEEELP